MEQRSKDGKSKQGANKASTHLAAASVSAAPAQPTPLGVQQSSPQSPTSPSRTFDNLKESLNNQENLVGAEDEGMKASGIEPSADMANRGNQINQSFSISRQIEPSVDQNLQTAEEAFFETIDQVFSGKKNNFF